MLHRIIRAFFFGIPVLAFLLLATRTTEPSLLPFYYATNADYQSYLEEVRSFGQGELPRGKSSWGFRDPSALVNILRIRLDSTKWKESQIQELAKHILRLSYRYRFPPALILSMIEVESGFVPTAVSGCGAVGLMQVMPATAIHLAAQLSMPWDGVKSLRDPLKNLELGLQYMVELRRQFKHPRRYLTAYNIGPAALIRKLKNKEPLSDRYYNKVMRSYREYSAEVISEAL